MNKPTGLRMVIGALCLFLSSTVCALAQGGQAEPSLIVPASSAGAESADSQKQGKQTVEILEIISYHNGPVPKDYKNIVYSISQERAAALPHYDPENGSPPVSIEAAIKTARETLGNDSNLYSVIDVSLRTQGKESIQPYIWFYLISFKNSENSFRTPTYVPILMDGRPVFPEETRHVSYSERRHQRMMENQIGLQNPEQGSSPQNFESGAVPPPDQVQ